MINLKPNSTGVGTHCRPNHRACDPVTVANFNQKLTALKQHPSWVVLCPVRNNILVIHYSHHQWLVPFPCLKVYHRPSNPWIRTQMVTYRCKNDNVLMETKNEFITTSSSSTLQPKTYQASPIIFIFPELFTVSVSVWPFALELYASLSPGNHVVINIS